MRNFLLSIASPETLGAVGFWILIAGLIGGLIILERPEKRPWHIALGVLFAGVVLAGHMIGHIGDGESLRIVAERAKTAEGELKKITSPRNINPDERAKLVSCLKASPTKGPIFIRPGLIDSDATLIAENLRKIFEEAGGFDKKEWPEPALTWTTPGIFLIVTDLRHAPQHATEIQKCFWGAGRQIYGYPDPKHPADSVSIGIGPRL